MKNFLSISSLLTVLASTVSAAPYVLPSPQTGALTPLDWQPVYAIEGLYSINEDHAPNTWGLRGSFNLYNNASDSVRHQFSLNAAPQWGHDTYNEVRTDLFLCPFTAGYDLNVGLTDSIFLDLGAKAGYMLVTGEEKYLGRKDNFDCGGFTYSVGAGVKVMCSDSVSVKVGYEFGRSFLRDKSAHTNLNQHMITVGIGCSF